VFDEIPLMAIEIRKHDHAITWLRMRFMPWPLLAGIGSHKCDISCMGMQKRDLTRQDRYQALEALFSSIRQLFSYDDAE
jgi:hypothetical protein